MNKIQNKATLTKAGAERILCPELAGRVVEYDKIHELGLCVENVYYQDKRLCGPFAFKGHDAGLVLLDKED